MADRDEGPLRKGDVVDGRYRVEALIGRGGYGAVYRAVQLAVQREVAIKVVDPGDREAVARFRREGELIKLLEHPHTVRVFDVGAWNGIPFLAMELLRGLSLHAMITRDGRIAPQTALEVTAQILKALAEAHQKGFVHRDIKPENVFVTSHAGEPVFVKVLDFGIAKRRRSGDAVLTVQGAAPGTPNYMAPEQILGHEPDARSDVYAVGLVLAEMLTGRTVFESGGAQTLMQAHLSHVPAPLDPVIDSLPGGDVVRRAVEKSTALRFQSATEMLAAIEARQAAAQGDAVTRALPAVRRPTAFPPTAFPPTPFTPTPFTPTPFTPTPFTPTPFTPTPFTPTPFAPAPLASIPSPTPMVASNASTPMAFLPTAPARVVGATTQPPLPERRALVLVLAVSAVVLAITVGVLVAILALRSDSPRATDRVSKTKTTEAPPVDTSPIPLDPRVRRARTASMDAIKSIVVSRGWAIDYTTDNSIILKRSPCHGSVTVVDVFTPENARRNANLITSQNHFTVLLSERALVSVALMREGMQMGVDAACTRDVVELLAD